MNAVPAMIRALAEDRTSGAAEIAAGAAMAIAGNPPKNLHEALEALLRGHPSMAPLWRLATTALRARDPAAGARSFLEDLAADARASGVLAEVLPETVLTISWSSSVLAALRRRAPAEVVCMLSEPGGEGASMAEAVSSFAGARVVGDDEAIERVPAGCVVVGADAITPEAVINKVKTGALLASAGRLGVPAFTIAGSTKLVGRPLPVVHPFEAAPLEGLSGIATDRSLMSPERAREAAAGHDLHPDLLPLLEELEELSKRGRASPSP